MSSPELFELCFIRAVLADERYFMNTIKFVEPNFIQDSEIRETFYNLQTFYEKYERIPNATEIGMMSGEDARKTLIRVARRCLEVDPIADDILVEKTLSFIKEKLAHKVIRECVSDFQSDNLDPATAITRFESIAAVAFNEDLGIELFRDIKRVRENLTTEIATISTGWKWLDHCLRGGWLKDGRALYLFQGAANVGKSIWLGNTATNLVRQGRNVLLVSFEMNEMVYAERLVSGLTKIPISKLKESGEAIENVMSAMDESLRPGRLYIKEFPPSMVSVPELKAFIKKFSSSGHKIDVIVIDYINLIRGTEGDNSYNKIKDIAEKLRALSYIFKVPIITATQIGRGKNKGYGTDAPDLDDVSESLGLVQTADVVMGIWQQEGDAEMGVMNLSLPKNRYGKKNVRAPFRIDYTTLTIGEDKYTEGCTSVMNPSDAFNAVAITRPSFRVDSR